MKIDIMLPYYGPVDLMQASVRSVLAQDDPDWRLTVVDDGYPDDSIPGWFESLGDDRVHYIRNPHNLGANRNYQRCLDLVQHELVVIMGADDVMLPNYVRTVRSAHEAYPTAAVIQPGVQVIDGDGRPSSSLVDSVKRLAYAPKVQNRTLLGGEALATSLLRGNWLYFPALCWRAGAMKSVGFRNGLTVVQDLALVLDLVERGDQLLVDPKVCFQYRRHSASDSSWRALAGGRFVEERAYFLDTADRMGARGWRRAERAARWHISSRLHALTLLPLAIRRRHTTGIRNLSRHAFGWSRRQSLSARGAARTR